jgi:aspartyl-tRNA(Asn)/glutamyl-tRNA(Gln) amidotransferase subunit A
MVPDYLTIAEAARLIEKRELSPVELVDSRLDRIARVDGRLHSFIRVLADAARHEARATEAEIAAGKYRGPLHGIPIGLKDIYETAGVATTGHSKVMQDHVPQKDAFSVQRKSAVCAEGPLSITPSHFSMATQYASNSATEASAKFG